METNLEEERTFAKYAAKKFQSFHTCTADKKPLHQPLHHFKTVLDKDTARAISLAIFRYTKEGGQPQGALLNQPIFRELISGLKKGSVDGNFNPYSFFQRWKTTDLDNVQFICGLGILGSQMRDEIFCQIYKQINGNSSEKVRKVAWSLFACCLTSFPPSGEFYPYLISILKSAPQADWAYCTEKLRRTLFNGQRNEPPSSYEYQAIINQASISIAVHLPNEQSCKLTLDSATTGLEFKKQIKAAKRIVDLFGFAFYVSIGREMLVIVSGNDHVMDVISSCEQRGRNMQLPDPCRVSFFKEIFSPWHSFAADKVSTELIYNQIIFSIKSGEYKIHEDEILGKIIAVHCYLLHGVNANKKQIENVTRSFHINSIRNSPSKGRREWAQLVETCFAKKFLQKRRVNRIRAAGEVVHYAKLNLTGQFSRIFRCTSSDSPETQLSLAINCLDVRLYSGKSSQEWKISFSEMKNVTFEKFKNETMGTVIIHTIYTEAKQIKSMKGEKIHELLNFFLTGLRKRSRYLLAVLDRSQTGINSGRLEISSGDLIVLDKNGNGETIEVTGRGHGTCQRTGLSGDVSGGVYYIIPVIEAPSESLLAALRKSELKRKEQRKDLIDLKPMQVQEDKMSASSGLLPEITRKNTSSDEASSRVQGWVESNKEPTIYQTYGGVDHRQIVENSSSEQLHQYKYISNDPPRNQLTEQRNIRHVIDPTINIPKKSYQELQAELYKSKTHVTSTNEDVVNGGPLSLDQEDLGEKDLNQTSTVDQAVPDIVIHSVNTEISEEEVNAETTIVVVHKQVLDVGEDEISVSLEHDIPEKYYDETVLTENHEEDRSDLQENTHKSAFKDLDWSPERFGFPSFEESNSYKALITYIHQPAGDVMSEMKLTDSIFGRPLGNRVSEEHVYREIIKHIEAEENDTTVERSWELMWLITGLYSCSDNIKDEVINFLRARTDSNLLAKQCYMRLVKMITHGRRTYPPHIAEVQAIQTRMDLINHKVFFPDGSCQSFEVESATTARHLISVITENIGLKYPSGCGLFFKIGDKVFGAAEEYFFFDFIQHFIEVWRRSEGGDGIAINYQVFFLRKVWINVIPGEDRVADCRLHYYQELSKYLRGYHRCTEMESILLATLILRAEFGEDTEHLSEIPDMLNKLVPHEMISLKSVDEWQQVIEKALSENVTSFGDDAKIEFLKEISQRPTFGTAFFSVKTNLFGEQPETLLLAIQKDGLALINAADKTVIERYNFSEVEKWTSGEKKITIEVKVNEERKNLEFETSLDYQIDDFLTSYISAHGSENREVSDDI